MISSISGNMISLIDVLHRLYRKSSNISRTLVGNKIVDHSDVVGASPAGAAPTTSSFWQTLGFNGLDKDNYKTRRGIVDRGIWCALNERLDGIFSDIIAC